MFQRLGGTGFHLQVDGPDGAPAVLMLHSLSANLHIWDPQARALAKTYRVVRMDLRGHGLSEVPAGPYSMAMLAGDAFALLDALGVTVAHVTGLSIGGRIALQMAKQAPSRVASLMLCDTALEMRPPEMWQQRIEAVTAEGTAAVVEATMGRWVVDATLASATGLRRMILATDRAGYCGAAAALRDCSAAEVAGIACPTTIIVGEKDTSTPVAAAQAINAAIPGSRLVVVPDAAHIPCFEQETLVTRTLLAHLEAAS